MILCYKVRTRPVQWAGYGVDFGLKKKSETSEKEGKEKKKKKKNAYFFELIPGYKNYIFDKGEGEIYTSIKEEKLIIISNTPRKLEGVNIPNLEVRF